MDTNKTLSILSFEKKEQTCPNCRQFGTVYVCHGHGLSWPERTKIREMCKLCGIIAANGEEHIHVKMTYPYLQKVWDGRKRPSIALSYQISKSITSGRF